MNLPEDLTLMERIALGMAARVKDRATVKASGAGWAVQFGTYKTNGYTSVGVSSHARGQQLADFHNARLKEDTDAD